ncbi:hypothetical protein [Roseivirga sp.]|uniref:hypothetical protein n=1 Tax=Roseivirga sp. TaxID=1964215 RepID=UPI002B272185|nr:hypothetical protein [Roseivirga sp.]
MKRALQIVLAVIALIMIYLGVINSMLPPALTGIGFIVILMLFNSHHKIRP